MNWHDYFLYDPDSGNLIWKSRALGSFASERMGKVWNTRFAGKVAGGGHNGGYLHVAVDGEKTLVQRVVWEMHKGKLMDGEKVDHRDMDRKNNRIGNLRKCSNGQNMMNRGPQANNTTGFKGVTTQNGAWVAQIQVANKNIYLGRFQSPEEAHAAYCEAAKGMHGQFARTA